jgi:peptidoglycan-associated lipoprotein
MRLAHLDPSSSIARERSVFFEYDAVDIAPQYRPLLERHGQYLRTHPAVKVIIEGNADERGGPEYNLALGQRRSESVKSALRLLGATDAQLDAISFGEEKPVAAGHDETSWQRNRRADIVYLR